MQTHVSIPGIHCASCAALIKDVSSEFSSINLLVEQIFPVEILIQTQSLNLWQVQVLVVVENQPLNFLITMELNRKNFLLTAIHLVGE
jgi:hypothetical protein